MALAWQKRLKNGLDCAKALKIWLKEQRAANQDLRWSDQDAWEECLFFSDIIPLVSHFCCTSKRCEPWRGREGFEFSMTCPPERNENCDWWILNVFEFIAPVGTDLKLLRRYLAAGGSPKFLIDEKDSERRGGEFHDSMGDTDNAEPETENERVWKQKVKATVIWSFVVHWVEEHVPEAILPLGYHEEYEDEDHDDMESKHGVPQVKKKPWNDPQEVSRLIELRKAQKSYTEIARELNRTKDSVKNKVKELEKKGLLPNSV